MQQLHNYDQDLAKQRQEAEATGEVRTFKLYFRKNMKRLSFKIIRDINVVPKALEDPAVIWWI